MKDKINLIVKNLENFFGAKVIGSYLFYKEGLLDFEDLNDIDILVSESSRQYLANYMDSLGFKETIKEGKQIGYKNRTAIYEKLPQGDFKDTIGNIPLTFDVQVGEVKVLPLHEIVALKFKRASDKDRETLSKIMKRFNHETN